MAKAFEVDQWTIGELFSDRLVFSFPAFQRPYRWSIENALELLSDLTEAAERSAADAEPEPFFIGSMVLRKLDARRRDVVDGRQRLTTLAILLAVLRDLSSAEPARKTLHEALHDAGDSLRGVEPGFRLRLDDIDVAEFTRYVLAPGATAEAADPDAISPRHAAFVDVAATFRTQLAMRTEEQRAALAGFTLRHCEAIAIVTGNENQAYRIFEVINARGLPLTQVDLTRLSILKSAPEARRLELAEKLDYADNLLGDDTDRLYRALLFAFVGGAESLETFSADDLAEQVVRYGVERFVDELLTPSAEAYARLLDGDLEYADDARNPNPVVRALEWTNDRSQDWLPFMIEALRAKGDEFDVFHRLLIAVDKLWYYFAIIEQRPERRRLVFKKALDDLRSGADPARVEGPLWLEPDEIQQIRRHLRGPMPDRPWLRRSILRRIEIALTAGEPHPKLQFSQCEHVLPFRYPRGGEWTKLYTPDAHRQCAHLLGNMTLLDKRKNERISQDSFADKKRQIFRLRGRFRFKLTEQLRAIEAWTPEVIHQRTDELAGVLLKTWGLPEK